MANFGARLAYPIRAPRAAYDRGATLRRAWRALCDAFDDAPFHLLWPPAAPPSSLPGRGAARGLPER